MHEIRAQIGFIFMVKIRIKPTVTLTNDFLVRFMTTPEIDVYDVIAFNTAFKGYIVIVSGTVFSWNYLGK